MFKLSVILIYMCSCLLHHINGIQNKKIEKVYLQQEISDLDNSASGYMYRSDGHGPSTYVDLSGHPAPAPQKYGLIHPPQPAASTNYVAPSTLNNGGHYTHLPIQQNAYTSVENYGPAQFHPQTPTRAYVAPVAAIPIQTYEPQPILYSKPAQYSNYILPQQIHAIPIIEGSELVGGGGEEKDSSFKKGGGEKYLQEEYAKHGEKGEKGYDSKHGYEKGQKGEHDKEEHKGYYDENAGKKAGYDDKVAYYKQGHVGAKGSKGETFHETDGHKKGSKTTGFHNVYHKDEYKKDHTFYDEADKSGHFEKHGDQGSQQSSAAGGFKKGGSGDSGYHHDKHGKKGHYDKGHFVDQAEGHKGEHGAEEYYQDHEKYGKEGGHNEGNQYGYNDGESSGKYYTE